MRKSSLLAFVIVAFVASTAFGNPTDELFKAVQASDSTPEQVRSLIEAGADVNAEARITLTVSGKTETNIGTVLMAACANNDNPSIVEIVRTLIDEGAFPGAKVQGEPVALMTAVSANLRPELFKLLLESGVDLETKAGNGANALMLAAMNTSYPEIFVALVNEGADTTLKDKRRRTLQDYVANNRNPAAREKLQSMMSLTEELFKAVQDNSTTPEKVRELVQKGALVNAAFEYDAGEKHPEAAKKVRELRTELVKALEKKNEARVQELVAEMSKYSRDVYNGKSNVLHAALLCGASPEVIREIVRSGADVNAEDRDTWGFINALLKNYDASTIMAMIEAGADVNKRATNGFTPLLVAAGTTSDPEVIRILLEVGADVSAKYDGRSVIDFGKRNSNESVNKFISENESHFKKVISATEELFTALQDSSTTLEKVNALIQDGALVNAVSEIELTNANGMKWKGRVNPLMLASAYTSDPEIIRALVRAGADVEGKLMIEKGFSFTPLIFASAWGNNPENVRALIECGANVNARTERGFTALMAVAGTDNVNVARVLLDAGAKKKLRNSRGESAIDIAAENPTRSPEMKKLLGK